MGRELKRVSLDFKWPVKKVWEGYLNPHCGDTCPTCDGDGLSPEMRRLKDLWYGRAPFRPEDRGSAPWTVEDEPILAFAKRNVARSPSYYGTGGKAVTREAKRLADLFNGSWGHHINDDDVAALVAADRLWDFTRTWSRDEGWKPKEPPYIPTAREVNAWSIGGMGHDSINAWVCIKAEAKRLGLSETCDCCGGEGVLWPSPEAKAASEAWEPSEPPTGAGYQMWETVSEGSPISPVFNAPERLADWLAGNRHGTVDEGRSAAAWLAFIEGPGWAPSMISSPETGLVAGVDAVITQSGMVEEK